MPSAARRRRARLRRSNDQRHLAQQDEEEEPSLKAQLIEVQSRTPRFLFRGWNNTPADPSGGYVNLNTLQAVTPLAYLDCAKASVTSIFDQDRSALSNMVTTHLGNPQPGEGTPPTQFSSWASSLSVAVSFAIRGDDSMQHDLSPYIPVIDTTRMKDSDYSAHVPDLTFLSEQCDQYAWEYLVHGVMDGACYKAIPLARFENISFPSAPSWGAYPLMTCHCCPSPPLPVRSKREIKQDMDDALKVAKAYGTSLTLVVFLAIVCQKFKQSSLNEATVRRRREITQIVDFVGRARLNVSRELCVDFVMLDGAVYTGDYREVEVMLLCMRLLVMERYPEEAGKRWPDLASGEILGSGVTDTKGSRSYADVVAG